MALMVIHQGHEGAMAAAVLQHVLWLLECAAGGLIPGAVCTPSWQGAAAACVAACTSALSSLSMLGMFADRCVLVCMAKLVYVCAVVLVCKCVPLPLQRPVPRCLHSRGMIRPVQTQAGDHNNTRQPQHCG